MFRFRELWVPLVQTCQGTLAELGCCKHLGRFESRNSFSRLNVEKRGWFCSPGAHRPNVFDPLLQIYPLWRVATFNIPPNLWRKKTLWGAENGLKRHVFTGEEPVVWKGESHREDASVEAPQKQPDHQKQDVLQDGSQADVDVEVWGQKTSHLSHQWSPCQQNQSPATVQNEWPP